MFEIRNYIKSTVRTGRQFRELLDKFAESGCLKGQELRDWQFYHLKRTIDIAYENVPFYRNLFVAAGLHPSDIKQLSEVKWIPVTEKESVRKSNADFFNTSHRGPTFNVQTSGSTGKPLRLKRDIVSINTENAFLWRFWQSHGKQFDSRRASMRGDLIGKLEDDRLWVYNRFQKELMVSPFHLNDRAMDLIIDKLNEFNAFDLYATPSAAFVLADYAARSGKTTNFEAIFTSSEQLFGYQINTIEQQFSSRVWDWYGQAERVTAIAHCRHGNYHLQEDYALTELQPVCGGEYGEFDVIGTSFFNHLMPLLRYKTGDRIKLANMACPCGSPFKVVQSISGRANAYLETPDGRKISAVQVIPRGIPSLIEAQFIQESLSSICIKVVCEESFSAKESRVLIQRARDRVSPDILFRVEKVEAIPRTAGGKFMPIIPLASHLRQGDGHSHANP